PELAEAATASAEPRGGNGASRRSTRGGRTNGEARERAAAPRAPWAGTPRNAACPCGSGKKFKHCHGALV
ncbi:MAG TPA: SEC-C metal-binding domain-containing protein, partial [Caulobacteraceae bacterium]|nr:SEC-C metal-binding domain-containing protein [Caulobacteraceae bacterium]